MILTRKKAEPKTRYLFPGSQAEHAHLVSVAYEDAVWKRGQSFNSKTVRELLWGGEGETHLAGDFREKQRSLTIFQKFFNIFIILLHPKVRLEFL